jgi:hypothetical protein
MAIHIHKTLPNQVDWKVFVAILYQESSLRLDPQNCFKVKSNCTGDYGIGQINVKIWQKQLNLDKKRLKTDRKYSISKAIKVLEDYRKRYAHRDPKWYSRYHSSTPHLRSKYEQRIHHIISKL